jgi:hypothetical protein
MTLRIPPPKTSPSKKRKGSLLSEQYQKYLDKEIDDYNSKDLVFYFADVYRKVNGVPYFVNIVQDSAKLHRLVQALDIYTVVKLIDYVIENKRDITIGLLCSSWVNSFIKEAGITKPGFSKYEIYVKSPFLTEKEQNRTQEFFDKLVWASDHGDIHGEVYWRDKLEKVCGEVRRRKVLLSQTLEEDDGEEE